MCVRGRQLLYKYCKQHDIPHKQIGKLIVATGPSEVPKLNTLMTRGIENGVEGLKLMEGHEATRMEPELQCLKALLSPASGIVDTHSLMLSMMVWFFMILYHFQIECEGIISLICHFRIIYVY